jgi:multimeric flavodoxin WrbA
MINVSIIYFSGFRGHTRQLAEAVAEGTRRVPDVNVELIPVDQVDAKWSRLHVSDVIMFGSPTYVGSVAARFKEFIEKLAGDVWMQRAWTGKLAGGFTVSAGRSGDKLSTLQQLVIAAAQMGMIWVTLPVLGGNYSTQGSEEDLNRMAGYLGVMAQANIDEGPEHTPPASDLKTAQIYGEHIANIARQLEAGRVALGLPAAAEFSGTPRRLQEMLPPPGA